jgi:peptidoglycan/xylan/chitin deacetylase (PgdA/CDA1 family)
MLKSLLYSRYNPLPTLLPLTLAINLSGQRLVLPLYHTICDRIPDHIRHLYPPRHVKTFTEDMQFMLKHFEPIDLFRLKEIILTGEKPRRNLFFVSFDDGLSGFYHHAAPVLSTMGIPATCFLNSAFIDNKALFYRYKVSLLIEEIQKHKENPEFWKKFHHLKEKHRIPPGYYRQVLLSLDHTHTAFIDEAALLTGFDYTGYLDANQPYMTSLQIRELMDKGFTFGSHSVDHPDFQCLSEEERIDQALGSTAAITGTFGLDYRVFAFPFTDHGVGKSFFDAIYANGRTELSFGSAGLKHDTVIRNLQRIPMEEYNLSAERRLKTDYFYYLLKAVTGRNTIVR